VDRAGRVKTVNPLGNEPKRSSRHTRALSSVSTDAAPLVNDRARSTTSSVGRPSASAAMNSAV
jgi:hypothetical protein